MIPNLYLGNDCFTNNKFGAGCLGYQVIVQSLLLYHHQFIIFTPLRCKAQIIHVFISFVQVLYYTSNINWMDVDGSRNTANYLFYIYENAMEK